MSDDTESKPDDTTTTIATRMQAVGRDALQRAEALQRKERGDKFIDKVKGLLAFIDDREDTKATIEMQIAHARKRLAAIEAGDFSVVGQAVVYNDPELNRSQIVRGQTIIGLE